MLENRIYKFKTIGEKKEEKFSIQKVRNKKESYFEKEEFYEQVHNAINVLKPLYSVNESELLLINSDSKFWVKRKSISLLTDTNKTELFLNG